MMLAGPSIFSSGNFEKMLIVIKLVEFLKFVLGHIYLTHWDWDKMAAMLQTVCSNQFYSMDIVVLFISISVQFISYCEI